MSRRLKARRARLYRTVRTAHLERAHELSDAALVYRVRRYDFDESAASGLELVQASALGAAVLVARSRLEALEVNEPLMLSSLRMTALTVTAVRVVDLVTGHRTRVVSYAIENRSPWAGRSPSVRSALDRLLARVIAGRIDRLCFGTESAARLYADLLPGTGRVTRTIEALPAASSPPQTGKDPMAVVFVGRFSTRKGIELVLAAWPKVRAALPQATLHVLGTGPLEDLVTAAAAAESGVQVDVDPPRALLLQRVAQASVLTLPSQRTPTWREQVGLPIVEGLAAGCRIVTTSETGLATWLEAHGHSVIAAPSSVDDLAAAIVAQLSSERSAAHVLADLPAVDGRLAADAWLFEGLDHEAIPTVGSPREGGA